MSSRAGAAQGRWPSAPSPLTPFKAAAPGQWLAARRDGAAWSSRWCTSAAGGLISCTSMTSARRRKKSRLRELTRDAELAQLTDEQTRDRAGDRTSRSGVRRTVADRRRSAVSVDAIAAAPTSPARLTGAELREVTRDCARLELAKAGLRIPSDLALEVETLHHTAHARTLHRGILAALRKGRAHLDAEVIEKYGPHAIALHNLVCAIEELGEAALRGELSDDEFSFGDPPNMLLDDDDPDCSYPEPDEPSTTADDAPPRNLRALIAERLVARGWTHRHRAHAAIVLGSWPERAIANNEPITVIEVIEIEMRSVLAAYRQRRSG